MSSDGKMTPDGWRLNEPKDEQGQPNRLFTRDRTVDRCVQEMLGMARGIIADAVVNEREVTAFKHWIGANPDVTVGWPGNVLAERVFAICADGVISEAEREELRTLLEDTLGGDDTEPRIQRPSRACFNEPPPIIALDKHRFCFTGRFLYGTRAACQKAILERGGVCLDNVNGHLDYLVVGTYASEAWTQSPFGQKIQTAIALRDIGKPLAIVSEEHWVKALQSNA